MINQDFNPTVNLPLGRMFEIPETLRLQRELIRTQQYQQIGQIKVVGFERAVTEARPYDRTLAAENSIDFGQNGPVLAVSRGGHHLLVLAPMKNLLPLIPQPGWKPASRFVLEKAPMVRQSLSERASGWYPRAGEFYVFRPIEQITLMPYDAKRSEWAATYAGIRCAASQANGTHVALLFHARTHEMFFLGGAADWMPVKRIGEVGTPTGFLI